MLFESILLPFVLGIVTNKASDELFKDADLSNIVQQIYDKSEDEFNKKYTYAYGGKYNNFIARQENRDILLTNVIRYRDISKANNLNKESFDGKITPDELVQHFLQIFEKNFEADDRLIVYRGVKEHNLLTEEIFEEISKLTQIKIKKFEDVCMITDYSEKIQTYTINKTENEIDEIYNYLKQSEIVLIDSYRGFGKSETLYKIALKDEIKDMFENIIIMKHGVRNILDALQTEIIEGKRYLILIDDIDMCKNELVELINFIKVSKGNSKIVATTQTYMFEEMKAIIIKCGLFKNFKNISLNNWTKEDFIELLRKASLKDKIEDEEIIVVKYPSPALISWIGKSKIDSKTQTIEELFSEYQEVMKSDVHEILIDILPKDECDRLIFNISCTVPLIFDDNFKKAIKELMGIEEYELEKIINRLINGGVIRKIGYKYRFFPDIKGDIYLAYSLKNRLFYNDVKYWINNNQESVLENINESRFICQIDINEILKPVISEWLKADEYYQQRSILKKAIYIASFIPESILNLMYCYLEYAIQAKSEKYFKLTTDDFSPVLLQIWMTGYEKEAILDFIRLAENHGLNGMYDNYKVKGVIKSFFSPVNSPIEFINCSIEIIRNWIQVDKDGALIITKYALSELLKGSHEISKTIINGVQYGQKIVNATDEIISIRNKCISIIEYLVNEKFTYKTIQVVEEICDSIGKNNWGNINENDLPLSAEIVKERAILVDIIGNKLTYSNDISCNIVLERILLRWWATQYKGTESAGDYLINFTRSPEYLLAKYYVDASYRIFSFEEINKVAPQENRWVWFVHNIMHNDESEKEVKKIAELLNDKISSIEGFSILLSDTADVIMKVGACWSGPRILDEWCILNSKLFLEYIGSSFYHETYELFRGDIFRSITTINNEISEALVTSLLEDQDKLSVEEINSILSLAENKVFSDEFVVSIIYRIIRGDKLKNPRGLIHRLYFIFKERNKEFLAKILIDIVNKYEFDSDLCDMLDFIIKQNVDRLCCSNDFANLKEIIINRLIEVNQFDYHENSILETLLNSSEEALNFLVKRLSVTLGGDYRGVPFSGFTFLNNLIVNEDEYHNLITILINMEEEVNSYDKRYIYNPLFKAKDSKGDLIVCKLLTRYIGEKSLTFVLEILEYCRLLPETIKQFVEGIIYLTEHQMQKEAERLIISHMMPYEGWSRSIGTSSPEIIGRIELYKEMHGMLPYGRLKIITERCIEGLENDIKVDLIWDEELLNPR